MQKAEPRRWFLNLILLTVSLCVSVFIAELSLRTLDWYPSFYRGSRDNAWKPIFEYSSTRHHHLIPNVRSRHNDLEFDYIWATNALGMRDRERSVKKDMDSFRIFFIGDSVVQGWGVSQEQTMVALLEHSLNQPEREKRVEVLNGGVFGYSPCLEYLFLRETLPVIEPDLVLLGFFLGNDVGDDYFYAQQAQLHASDGAVFFKNDDRWPWSELDDLTDRTLRESGSVGYYNEASTSSIIKQYISDLQHALGPILLKLRLVRLVREVVQRHRQRSTRREWNERARLLVEEHRDDIRINLGLVNYPVLDREQRLGYWQISKKYLTAIHRLCQQRGVPLVLVVIPGAGPADFDEPYEFLDQIGYELSIPVIHFRSAFMAPLEKTSYPLDGHWNPEGNRKAAAIVDRELRRLNVLPPQMVKER
jgi:hypothetical protein